MIFLVSWVIIGVCTYYLWTNKIGAVLKSEGGYVEYMKKILEVEDKSLQFIPENLYSAAIKTGTLVAVVITWPMYLFSTFRMYLKKDEESLKRIKDKYFKRSSK